jgi:asparagine N-glycosylation enzyme membrane subunit Stt3
MALDNNNKQLWKQATFVVYILAAYTILRSAYMIRLAAIQEYGPVIHEFDPYFNYRATEVCVDWSHV